MSHRPHFALLYRFGYCEAFPEGSGSLSGCYLFLMIQQIDRH